MKKEEFRNNMSLNNNQNNLENNKNSNNKQNNQKNNMNLNNKSNNLKNNKNSNNRPNNSKKNSNSNNKPNNSKNKRNSNNRPNNSKKNSNSNNRPNNSKNNMNSNNRPNNSKNNMNSNNKPNNQKNNMNSNNKPNNQKNNKNSNNKQNKQKNNINSNSKQNNTQNQINSNNRQNNSKKNLNYDEYKPKRNKSNDVNTENPKNNIEKELNYEKVKQKNKEKLNSEIKVENKTPKKHIKLYIILIILILVLFFIGIFVYNVFNNEINRNVYIEDINVSKLEYSEAKEKIENEYGNILKDEVHFVYEEKEYIIKLEDIEFSVLSDEAVSKAKNIGKNKNILLAMKEYYGSIFGNEQRINLEFNYNEEKLFSKIKEIENNFYKEVKQYSYTIEENKLKIINGVSGIKIDYDILINNIVEAVRKRNLDNVIEIPINIEEPEIINAKKIHDEVFVEAANAYYEKSPFKIYNEVIGVDFDIEQLNQMLQAEPKKEEYIIDLQITEPQIKVDDLGLYNDILGQCRTAYVNNPNRTTNLRLAASKINGKILMPGESFSYNEIVGERTVAAGYRNAAIYINGEVEDGLAGGICQISSTLYDAVVFSNLQVDERFNHARVPSYVTAGRDATVYWGSKDFKFTNNREYPIKIELTVNGGYANAIIYGMKTDNEFDISFASSVVSRYNGYMVVKTYKVYKQNGVEIKRELISTDSYKV